MLVLVGGLVGTSMTRAAKPPPPPSSCTLVPQLRDVTVNQGLGTYSPLVNGKETLVRFFLSMPSCAGSGAMIQIKEGTTLTVSGGGSPTIVELTPVPLPTAYPAIASFTAAPMTDSTGDPKFIVPASTVTRTAAFTAGFSALIRFQSQPTRTSLFTAGQVTFSIKPGTTSTTITASFDKPSNALGVLFVPMGDATQTYSTQWKTEGQQALQDGMTAAVARQYPLPAGIGNLGGTGGLRYTVAPTLLDLTRVGPNGLNLLVAGKFCGTGANYDLIKAELAQFLLAHNTVNTNAKANRVVGVVDPAVGLGPPDPCFEGMAVVNSQEAWALARPGRAGQLIGLELAHTLGLTPPPRESPFDGAHSQNITAENPSVNRRYNLVQRSFITTDRSLMKPSGTNPSPDNINTLLEVPDFAFLLCVLGGTMIPECQTHGPGTVSATAPVAASLSFVMSGTTDSTSTATLGPSDTGTAVGTSVFESYFASSIDQTTPSASSAYRLVQRASADGTVLLDQGVPVRFLHSEHKTGSTSSTHSSGLFSIALPFLTNTNRVELWKGPPPPSGQPPAPGSLLLFATDRTQAPVLSSFSVGEPEIGYRPRPAATDNRLRADNVEEAGTVTSDRLNRPATSSRILLDVTFVVNDTGNGSDANLTDDVCDANTNPDINPCTLRAAIQQANATAGADTITFSISEGGQQTIQPTSALPTIIDPVTIDATTQEGFDGSPLIELNGSAVDGAAHGFNITAGSSTIKGFVIDDFGLDGIHLETGGGNTVVSNWIGTDQSGNEPSPNLGDGIQMEGSDENQIGGTTAAERNVVSSSGGHGIFMYEADDNTVVGNYVGTDVAGLEGFGGVNGFGNGIDGIALDGSSNNSIGGNVTSGNTNQGVAVFTVGSDSPSNGNTIEDNTVGLDLGGAALPNGGQGVLIASGVGNTIRQNSISSNGGLGIDLSEPDESGVTGNDESDDDDGSNNLQNFPVLDSVSPTQFSGSLDTTPHAADSQTYVLDFFENLDAEEGDPGCDPSDHGEGQLYVGSRNVEIGSSGFSEFTFTFEPEVAIGSYITATATDQNGNTSEFSECIQVEESLPDFQESWSASAGDIDNIEDVKLDGSLDCGPGQTVWSIFNGRKPDSVVGTTAFWSGTFDSSLAPAGCTFKVKPNDSFTQGAPTPTGDETVNDGPNSLVAAISSPPHVTPVATFLQYSLIPLRGLVMNPDGVRPGSEYVWTLTGPIGSGIARSGTGTFLDEQPPSDGWPTPGGAATYTATLFSQFGTTSATDTVTFTIKADADNDGIARDVEAQTCFGLPPPGVVHNDSNPLNADDDSDNDGIPNASDPQPCTPASPADTANIEFNPDPFPTPSTGNAVTVYVRVPGRNVGQVLSSSVRITRIADQDVSGNPDFKNIAWSVSGGVGTAKFDRQKLIQFLAANNIHNRSITVTVAGNSSAPAWRFEGSDTVFVQG